MKQLLLLSLALAACAAPLQPAPSNEHLAPQLAPDLPSPPLPIGDLGQLAAAFERAPPRTQGLYLADLLLGADLADDDASRALLQRLLGSGRGGLAGLYGEAAQRTRRAGLLELARLQAQRAAELSGSLGVAEAAMLRHRLSGGGDVAAPTALLLRYGSCARAARESAALPRAEPLPASSACLHALSPEEADPAREGPASRQGDGSWSSLRGRMAPLLEEAARRAPRLAPLVGALRQRHEALLRELTRPGAQGG